MKHTIELKLPKLFGKRTEEELNDNTEVVVKNRDISKVVSIGLPLVFGLTAGYFIGFHKGVNKNTNMYIIK